jgi:gliding motility-associated-like protein
MPTAFTPNRDGVNDLFKIPDLFYFDLIDFSIYSRWGQLIFKTNNITDGWDGTFKKKFQNSDTFVWQIKYRDLNNNEQIEKGTVILIR